MLISEEMAIVAKAQAAAERLVKSCKDYFNTGNRQELGVAADDMYCILHYNSSIMGSDTGKEAFDIYHDETE